jgi:hypothetical protein
MAHGVEPRAQFVSVHESDTCSPSRLDPGIWDAGVVEQEETRSTEALDVRASDAERNEVIDRLRAETAAGRLTLDEFEDRLSEVWAAKTRRQLDHTLRELPVARTPSYADVRAKSRPQPEPDEDTVRRRYAQRVRKELAGFATSNVTCVSIWALMGFGYFWPGWVLMGTGTGLIATLIKGRDSERERMRTADRSKEIKAKMRAVEARYR